VDNKCNSIGSIHKALANVQDQKLFLNHQSATEYVLVFNEGQVYIRLHQDFEGKIQFLLQKWADDRKIKALQWHFTPSCSCSVKEQSLKDAAYYCRRGLFHSRKQSRENAELAYQYLREAHNQDWNNTRIQENYAMALVVLRTYRNDPILDGHLDRGEHVCIKPSCLFECLSSPGLLNSLEQPTDYDISQGTSCGWIRPERRLS
jgi:hypothetical protein